MSFGPSVRNGLGIGLGPTATLSTAFSQATLDFDFIDNLVFPTDITFTRASSATYFNSAGVLTTAATNVPRLDYNPATLAPRGLLIEEQRVNSIRNNTMQGAVAGTPGTLPTNWGSAAIGGLTREILGVGTESGITYIDVRISGTTTGAVSGSSLVLFESSTQVAAASGQTWTASSYVKLQAGSFANTTGCDIRIDERDVAGGFLIGSGTSISTATSAALSTQRFSITRTFTNASTAYTNARLSISANSGAAINITLRIGLPQLEQGAFATSVIPTTTAAATRSADVASVNTLSPWYNATSGTVYFEGVSFDSVAANFPRAFQFNNGTNSNIIQITRNNSSGNARMSVLDGGSTQAAADSTAWTLNATTKSALAYATNDFAIATNGGAVTTDTSGTVPSATTFLLGIALGPVSPLNGYIRRITYYPRRLSNAELQAITA